MLFLSLPIVMFLPNRVFQIGIGIWFTSFLGFIFIAFHREHQVKKAQTTFWLDASVFFPKMNVFYPAFLTPILGGFIVFFGLVYEIRSKISFQEFIEPMKWEFTVFVVQTVAFFFVAHFIIAERKKRGLSSRYRYVNLKPQEIEEVIKEVFGRLQAQFSIEKIRLNWLVPQMRFRISNHAIELTTNLESSLIILTIQNQNERSFAKRFEELVDERLKTMELSRL